jgi:hypothetical protein
VSHTKPICFLIPVRDDYESVRYLLAEFRELSKEGLFTTLSYSVLLVDDGSQEDSIFQQDQLLLEFPEAETLQLHSRLGHQSAIFFGLRHIAETKIDTNVVILDGDGEDRPMDAMNLANQLLHSNRSVICARRLSRDVGAGFRFGYRLFTWGFRRLVGFDFRSGNFMAISSEYLSVVLGFSGIRNHVAAAVVRYSSNIAFQEFNRGSRIEGRSKMNLSNLTLHGYGAFSVYADILLARICIVLFSFSTLIFLLVVLLSGLRLFNIVSFMTGWTSSILVQLLSLIFILTSNTILILLLLLRVDKRA